MDSRRSSSSIALFLALNLLFFSLVSACGSCPGSISKPQLKLSSLPDVPLPSGNCRINPLALGVCAKVPGNSLTIGDPPVQPCCSLIEGLVDLEAAVCLCQAIKANVLGINLNVPVTLSVLLNMCGKTVPQGWKCA